MDRSMKLLGFIPHFKHTVANYRLVQYLQFLALAPRREPRHRLTGFILPYPRGDHCVWSITYTCSHPLARISVLRTILSAEFIAGSSGIFRGPLHSHNNFPVALHWVLPSCQPSCSLLVVWVTLVSYPRSGIKKTITVPCRSASQFVRNPPPPGTMPP